MSQFKLSQDELGEKGESRFKEICADAKLICNKSDRDRAGWDFILDFPYEEQVHSSLDKRRAPHSCHIQVKSIYFTTTSVRLKLNMAERLAKEPKPTFIVVIKVSSDLVVVQIALIHMIGKRLASVLKRLRQESANKTSTEDLNKKFISFTPRREEQIALNGGALRQAIEKACGNDPAEYVKKKQFELKSLGFDHYKFEAEVALAANSRQELAEIFLGLRENVPVNKFEAFESRFDIRLPNSIGNVRSISIKPNPVDTCSILIRGEGRSPSARFVGEIYGLPEFLQLTERRFHIKTPLFRIDLYETNNGVRHEFHFDFNQQVATLEQWWNLWCCVLTITKNDGYAEITPKKMGGAIRLPLRQAGRWHFPNAENYLKFCDGIKDVLRLCSMGEIPAFEWGKIVPEYVNLLLLHRFLHEPIEEFSCDFLLLADEVRELDGKRVILANKVQISDRLIAYYALAQLVVKTDPESPKVTFSNIIFGRAELILPEEFEKFSRNAQELEHVDMVCYINGQPQEEKTSTNVST